MMKNIYQIPGGYQLQKEDFKFNILYTDPSPLNYITQAGTTFTNRCKRNTIIKSVSSR
jgi:cell surface protein SprA